MSLGSAEKPQGWYQSASLRVRRESAYRICPLPNPSLNLLQGLPASLYGILQNLLEFYLFSLRERPQHTSHHGNLNSDLSITDDRGERLSHRRSSNLPLLLRARRGGLKEMFQCIFAECGAPDGTPDRKFRGKSWAKTTFHRPTQAQ